MTDDVKALAERLLERMKSKTGQQIDGRYAPSFYMEWDAILDRKAADMLTRLASQREDGDAVMAETNRCAQIVRSCVGTDCDFETAAQLILNRNFK